jgi:hypothetical protein
VGDLLVSDDPRAIEGFVAHSLAVARGLVRKSGAAPAPPCP